MNDMISVIVPVHNAEQHLKICLNSIVQQEYKELDIILVDDGSTDKSGTICDSYAEKDNRVHVIHKINEGVSEARNAGIDAAKGKYIAFIDSDDYIVEGYFSRISEEIRKREHSFLWWGYVKTSGYGMNEIEKTYGIYDFPKAGFVYHRRDILFLYLTWLMNPTWNKLYERKVLFENKIRMEKELFLGEDLLFNLEYMDHMGEKDIFIINEPLYYYVKNEKESLTNSYHKNKLEISKLLCGKIIEYGKKWEVSEGWGRFYEEYLYEMCLALNERFEKEKESPYWARIRENNYEMRKKEFTECIQNKTRRFSCFMEWSFRYRNFFFMRVDKKAEKIRKLFRRANGKNQCCNTCL